MRYDPANYSRDIRLDFTRTVHDSFMRRCMPRIPIMTFRFLLATVPLLSACTAHMPWQDDRTTELEQCHSQLAAQRELIQSLLLGERDEWQRNQQDIAARLEQLERLVSDSETGGGNSELTCAPPSPGEKVIFGRLEWLNIRGIDDRLKARIDTGATTSSLHAQDIVEFERDGKRWVRFKTLGESEQPSELEMPVARYIRVRQASSSQLERRPVVELPVNLGRVEQVAEFSLTDRKDMLYPALLGRAFFMDIAVVDVARKFVESKYRRAPTPVTAQP